MDLNSWDQPINTNQRTGGDSADGAVPAGTTADGAVPEGALPQGAMPEGAEAAATVVPIGDTWAEGVRPVSVAPRGRRARWAVALSLVACVALVSTAAAFVISGAAGSTQSLTAGHAPKGTVVFVSLRTDLPGDQQQKAADLWSHFPGGSDRAQFGNAMDEMLNKITRSVSPNLSYTSEFKPWIEGEVSVAFMSMSGLGASAASGAMPTLTPLTACATSAPIAAASIDTSKSLDPLLYAGTCDSLYPMAGGMSVSYPQAVVIVALKDRAAAEKWVTGQISKGSTPFTAQDYAGTKLYVTGPGSAAGAYAFTDDALLLGSVDAVKASLDTKANGSLADDANYKAAMKSLSGDSIATFYMATKAMLASEFSAMPGAMSSMAPSMDFVLESLPAWEAGSVRAESDRIVVTLMTPKTALSPSPGNKTSVLAGKLPASTIGVMEVHSVGKLVDSTISSLEGSGVPSTYKDAAAGIRKSLNAIGGLDWLGDASLVVTKSGSTFDGGVVAQAGDAATARAKVAMITNLVALSGSASGLKSRDETYKGTTITVVSSGTSGTQPLEVAIAAKDDLIVAGYSKAFVESVIDTAPGATLADKADYKAVTAAAGGSNFESGYVDIAAAVDEIGKTAFAADQNRWNLDIKPYLGQLGGAGFSAIDGNPGILRLVITVK